MKEFKSKRIKIVSSGDAGEFEKRLNDVFEQLAELGIEDYDVAYNMNFTNSHCAYVNYMECRLVATTLSEKAIESGNASFCNECCMLERSLDGRKKDYCSVHGKAMPKTAYACDSFYKYNYGSETYSLRYVGGEPCGR